MCKVITNRYPNPTVTFRGYSNILRKRHYTTHNGLEYHQDEDHARIINRRWSVPGIFHTLLGVAICQKLHIQPYTASDSTDGEIICMYKAVKKTKVIRRYM